MWFAAECVGTWLGGWMDRRRQHVEYVPTSHRSGHQRVAAADGLVPGPRACRRWPARLLASLCLPTHTPPRRLCSPHGSRHACAAASAAVNLPARLPASLRLCRFLCLPWDPLDGRIVASGRPGNREFSGLVARCSKLPCHESRSRADAFVHDPASALFRHLGGSQRLPPYVRAPAARI